MNKEKIRNITKKEYHLPYSERIMRVINAFSITEKVIFFFFVVVFVVSGITLLWQVNKSFLVEVPDYGGTLTEGIVGSPRFINPILSVSDIDRDLTNLIYSGLLRARPDGSLILDLAESYTISNDSLTYTFVLKNDIYFHDGAKVTVDDILFTIERAQDSGLKSPRKTNWEGVKSEKIDERTISFTLRQPYSPFIQNATLGILPKHIWNKTSIEEFPWSQFNIKPIGTGPYKIDNIIYTGSGLPSEYRLVANNKYTLGKPYITNLIIKAYQNEKDLVEGYKKGDIESLHSIETKQLPALRVKQEELILAPLPRVFGVFFNQNQNKIFTDKRVAQAINLAVDKEEIINEVLHGYGTVINDPIPPNAIVYPELEKEKNITREEKLKIAEDILAKAGWKLGKSGYLEKTITEKGKKMTTELQFSISTGNAPELAQAAELIRQDLAKIGMRVEIKTFEIGNLNQDIIRPRKYDSLLFGQIVGHESDLVAFWHSSQRLDPGLNVAMYANARVDKILEDAFVTVDEEKRIKKYVDFNQEIKKDMPAVFLYSPNLIYAVSKDLGGFAIDRLT
ncbi:MAG: hypothetical protein A2W64_02025, partial [Candidatus Zambryskibacteria bacterium RIFCSPLOWO2_02_39_10]